MVDAVEVSSIKIDTGYAGGKEYPIFARTGKNGQALPDAQCAIILGKNGSGKSTIARALSDGKNVELFDKGGNPLEGDCSNIYVFDERFIGENFRMSDEEALKLIYENRELQPLQEIISSMWRASLPDGFFDRILEPVRKAAKQMIPMPQVANQIFKNQINFNYPSKAFFDSLRSVQGINYFKIKENQISGGSGESHENFKECQVSELSHKKEESVAEE